MNISGFSTISIASVAALAGIGFYLASGPRGAGPQDLPEMRALPSGVVHYRPVGEFRDATRVRNAPLEAVEIADDLSIMRYPVTQQAYGACVADGDCKPTQTSGAPTLPQTQVSYRDALDFAAWQSRRTGQTWRLPTGPEWAHAAAERYVEEDLGETEESGDLAQGWLDAYRANAGQRSDGDPTLRAFGAYGENALGISYIGGNVWEWTSTCFKKGTLDEEGNLLSQNQDYCGVRLAQGLHRAFIIDFVRDASVGGCAVGLPPDHLAMRLVREG